LLASAAENFFLFASVDESLPRPPLGLVALHASAVYYLLEGLSEAVYLAVDTQYSYLDGAGARSGGSVSDNCRCQLLVTYIVLIAVQM
jgi:hypothetical protein